MSTTASGGVRFEAVGAVGRIVLDRPAAANAVDVAAARALGAAVTEAASTTIRAVTLTGEGSRFCAGGDVASFLAAEDRTAYLYQLATEVEAHLRRLSELPKPVVAGVHGAVAGAGLGFVLHADLVVAGAGTRFVFAYPEVGLTPDCAVSYLLPRVVGQQRALALALTGRVLSAEEALAWGLVTEVVDDEQVAARAAELAGRLAAGPTEAWGETKRLVRGAWAAPRPEHTEDEARTIARMSTTGDAERLLDRFVTR